MGDVESTGVFQPSLDAIDFYESLEGMLVAIPDAIVVGPRNAFGEVFVLADAGVGAAPQRWLLLSLLSVPRTMAPEQQ